MPPTEGYESGAETDDGNYSDTGSERGHSMRRYESAVLKIVQRVLIDSNIPLLKGVGEGASALVTRESRQALSSLKTDLVELEAKVEIGASEERAPIIEEEEEALQRVEMIDGELHTTGVPALAGDTGVPALAGDRPCSKALLL